MFKHVYRAEPYIVNVLLFIPFKYRSARTIFRCGIAPLRLQTGRYESLQPDQSTCFQCTGRIESEQHV